MRLLDGRRQLAIMLDYEFGRGAGRRLPKSGLKFYFSRRSDRLKQVTHEGRLFATIRPNGAIALTVYAADVLLPSSAMVENSVTVTKEAAEFVKAGRSVFCRFVKRVGKNVASGGEVVVLDDAGRVVGVGRARMPGRFMREFKAGVAVKVRGAAG